MKKKCKFKDDRYINTKVICIIYVIVTILDTRKHEYYTLTLTSCSVVTRFAVQRVYNTCRYTNKSTFYTRDEYVFIVDSHTAPPLDSDNIRLNAF